MFPKKNNLFILLLFFAFCLSFSWPDSGWAQEEEADETSVISLGDVTIQAEGLRENLEMEPGEIIINLEDYKKAGVPHTVLDILRDRAIIDFRSASDLSPGSDDIQMRGFDTRQFTTAIDGLAVQKLGGYWSGHFVDYSIIPLEQIESIEILPGPHSALYEGKSFGGVINIKTKAPVRRETPEVRFNTTASYASLDTYDTSLTMSGGGGNLDYTIGVKEYHTDGYLRNSDYDLSTISGRLAWLLPNEGYMSLLGAYSDKSRSIPCANDPDGRFDYDSSYPVLEADEVSGRWRDPAKHASREKNPHSIRFNWKQPTEIGDWTIGAYRTYEDQKYQTDTDAEALAETEWASWGARVQNDVHITDAHLMTFGFETANLGRGTSEDIVQTYGWYLQDQWQVTPHLSFRPGLRYEKVSILWNNENFRTGGYANPDIPQADIEKNYDEIMPKAFATYQLDGLADFLRDTSVSLGLSKIWSPRATCEV